jgi:DNA-binding NarL/FixJ family response regulator
MESATVLPSPPAVMPRRVRYTRRSRDLATLRDVARGGTPATHVLDVDETAELWRDIAAGACAVHGRVERDGSEYLLVRAHPRSEPLTARERQVTALAAAGLANKAIAHELELGVSTVSVYLMRAAEKLAASTRVELIEAWLARGAHRAQPAMLPVGLRAWRLSPALHIVALPAKERALPKRLTPAERAVALGILEGRTNEEIARARGTSVRTIANQVASIFKKLEVGSRGELAARYAGS